MEAFLKAASRKRRITVIVAETAPSYIGRKLALSLSGAGIPTLLIPDSGIFSLLSRISKVILGTHSVRADGSLIAISGSLPLAKAAREQKVPVIVLTGMFKVSPEFSFAGSTLSNASIDGAVTIARTEEEDWDIGNPSEVLTLPEVDGHGIYGIEGDDGTNGGPLTQRELQNARVDIEVLAPYYDRVPAELIDLFITNLYVLPGSKSSASCIID